MFRLRLTLLILLALACPLAAQTQPSALPASELLLPSSTQGWVSFADLDKLTADWKETQFGQLLADPAMRTFIDDLKSQLQKERKGIGLTWDDMLSVAGGETALALIHEENQRPAHVALIDVTGKLANVPAVMERLEKEITSRGATAAFSEIAGTQCRVFTNNGAVRLVYFKQDNLLVATDTREAAELLITRFKQLPQASLATDEAFEAVNTRLQKDLAADKSNADIRWFVRPIGMARAQRTLIDLDHPAPPEGKKGRDLLEIVSSTGFDGIKGAGGVISLRTQKYDVLSRIAVSAPRPWQKSLNMIALRNAAAQAVDAWVNNEVASHTTFEVDPVVAFDSVEAIFDATVGGGAGGFDDVMEGIADDPFGPQVNIRNEIVQKLTGRATLVTDNKLPIDVNSQRRVVALPIKDGDAAQVKESLHRLMEPDEDHARVRNDLVPGVEIWELLPDKPAEVSEVPAHRAQVIPVVSITTVDGQDDVVQPPVMHERESGAICVAEGKLFYASHLTFLVQVLQQAKNANKLTANADFQEVEQLLSSELNSRSWEAIALRRFGRTADEIRTTYELARGNLLHESESMLARLIRNRTEGALSEDGKQWFDGSKLPGFDLVEKYLNASGQLCHAETLADDGFDGWFIISMTVRKPHASEVEAQAQDK